MKSFLEEVNIYEAEQEDDRISKKKAISLKR